MNIEAQHRGDPIGLESNVTVEVHDAETGALIARERQHNLVTLAGRNLIRDALAGTAGSYAITHFSVGTGSAATTANDTTLGTERLRDVVTKVTPDAGKLTIQYYLASTAANGYTLTEAGLHNASSGGTMIGRVTYAGIAKTSSITVTYSWEISINAG